MQRFLLSTCGMTAEPTGDVKVQTTKVLASIDGLLESWHRQIETLNRLRMACEYAGLRTEVRQRDEAIRKKKGPVR